MVCSHLSDTPTWQDDLAQNFGLGFFCVQLSVAQMIGDHRSNRNETKINDILVTVSHRYIHKKLRRFSSYLFRLGNFGHFY